MPTLIVWHFLAINFCVSQSENNSKIYRDVLIETDFASLKSNKLAFIFFLSGIQNMVAEIHRSYLLAEGRNADGNRTERFVWKCEFERSWVAWQDFELEKFLWQKISENSNLIIKELRWDFSCHVIYERAQGFFLSISSVALTFSPETFLLISWSFNYCEQKKIINIR